VSEKPERFANYLLIFRFDILKEIVFAADDDERNQKWLVRAFVRMAGLVPLLGHRLETFAKLKLDRFRSFESLKGR
jgi:hypothetical protein